MNLSLCCIWLGDPSCKFKTMTYKKFSSMKRKDAIEELQEKIIHNFKVSTKILHYCYQSGIKGYRMSSSLCPLITHPDLNLKFEDFPKCQNIIAKIKNFGLTAKTLQIRVSSHPSEYVSLVSEKESVIENSINDLNLHGEIFDLAGFNRSHYNPINIHIRKSGNPSELSNIFLKNFNKLDDSVKTRLVLENNDTGETWGVKTLYNFVYKFSNIPITFDVLHHQFLNEDLSLKEAFNLAYSTWKNHIPIFHYSEGKDGKRNHADYAKKLPIQFEKEVYYDVELKQKNFAILSILEQIRQA